MASPSINLIGGTVAVFGLAALIFFGVQASCAPATPAPAPVTVAPTPSPAQEMKPERERVEHERAERPTHRRPVYHRLLKGGKVGPKVNCGRVPKIAYQYTPDQVIAAAKTYGLSPAQLKTLRACLN